MKHIKVFESFVPEELNEISSETIKSAADISIAQGQPGRASEILKTHFYNYMGKPFQNGTLTDIKINGSYDRSSIESVNVIYTRPKQWVPTRPEEKTEDVNFHYDVKNDQWKLFGQEIGKREARLLSGIATIMNPQTKYKVASQNLPIKGYGMEKDW